MVVVILEWLMPDGSISSLSPDSHSQVPLCLTGLSHSKCPHWNPLPSLISLCPTSASSCNFWPEEQPYEPAAIWAGFSQDTSTFLIPYIQLITKSWWFGLLNLSWSLLPPLHLPCSCPIWGHIPLPRGLWEQHSDRLRSSIWSFSRPLFISLPEATFPETDSTMPLPGLSSISGSWEKAQPRGQAQAESYPATGLQPHDAAAFCSCLADSCLLSLAHTSPFVLKPSSSSLMATVLPSPYEALLCPHLSGQSCALSYNLQSCLFHCTAALCLFICCAMNFPGKETCFPVSESWEFSTGTYKMLLELETRNLRYLCGAYK